MRAPAWDADFATNKVHGADAQAFKIMAALKHCKQRRRAIDIGAHIGIWTVALAKRFAAVHAFEPVGENFKCLQENTAGLENVDIYQQALGAYARQGVAVKHGGNSGCWYLAPGTGMTVMTLDMMGYKNVDLIKIDVEGLEGEVLEGASTTIAMYRPAVFFEENGLGPKHYGSNWVDPKPILRGHGYSQRGRYGKDELWLPN